MKAPALKGKVRWIKEGVLFNMYDEKGNLVYTKSVEILNKERDYINDTVLLKENYFIYDKKGFLRQDFGDFSFKCKREYEYDKKGRITKITSSKLRDTNDKILIFYRYDSKGAQSCYELHKGKEMLNKYTSYDKHGNVTEKIGIPSKVTSDIT